MKSRSEIWLRALDELGAQCSVSTRRDAETLASRVAQEGESFLTLTLPRFGKDFERSLALQSIPDDLFDGFKRGQGAVEVSYSHNGTAQRYNLAGRGTPRFLGGFLDLVFCSVNRYSAEYGEGYWVERIRDNKTGHVAGPDETVIPYPQLRAMPEDVDEKTRFINAIAAVRQLTLMFAKEKALCADSKTDAALASYEKTDQELDDPFVTAEPIPSLRAEGSSGPARSSLSYSDQLFLLWTLRSTEES
jgi:hypothetical protein